MLILRICKPFNQKYRNQDVILNLRFLDQDKHTLQHCSELKTFHEEYNNVKSSLEL